MPQARRQRPSARRRTTPGYRSSGLWRCQQQRIAATASAAINADEDEHGLEPVVEALRGVLFTTDADEAVET
jgi:hypothetical protein